MTYKLKLLFYFTINNENVNSQCGKKLLIWSVQVWMKSPARFAKIGTLRKLSQSQKKTGIACFLLYVVLRFQTNRKPCVHT